MTDLPDIDKLPPFVQWGLTVGAIIGGVAASILGWRAKSAQPVPPSDHDETERELTRLHNVIEFNKLRGDLEQVVRASRDSLFGAINELSDEFKHETGEIYDRLRAVENELAELRGARRQGVNPRRRED